MTIEGDDMKTVMLGVALMGISIFGIGCGAAGGADGEQSTLTIEAARISRSGEHFLVQGTSHGQPISLVTDSVVVEDGPAASSPGQADLLGGLQCYSCTSEDNGVHLNCVRVPCPDPYTVGSER
jgi:hypothetical protein